MNTKALTERRDKAYVEYLQLRAKTQDLKQTLQETREQEYQCRGRVAELNALIQQEKEAPIHGSDSEQTPGED